MRRLAALLIALAVPGAAQPLPGAVAPPPEVRLSRLPLALPHPEVQALAQDRDGLLWIGTADGLSRFDGLGVMTLRRRPGDASSLPSSSVRALHVARDGALYVGTDAGLARLNPASDTFARLSPASGRCSGPAVWLAEDAAGQILFGSRAAGVCRFDPESGRAGPVALPWDSRAPARGRAWSLAGLPDGSAWVLGPEAGEACAVPARGGRCEPVGTGGFLPRLLGHDDRGRLLALGRAAPRAALELRRLERGRFTPLASALPDVGWSEASRITAVGGEAWVETATAGVLAVRLDGGGWRRLAPVPGDPGSLPAARVGALLVDRQGGVWLGTSRGLAVWRPPVRPFTLYRRFTGRPGELSDDRVNGMAEDRDGALWVATNGGLNRLDPQTGRFETFLIPESQGAGPTAWAPERSDPYRDAWWQVLPASDGVLWVGGKRNGLFRLDARTGLYRREVEVGQALGLHAPGEAPRGFGVRHVFEDRAGRLWVGTTGEGLAVRQPETGDWRGVRPSRGDSALPHPSVNRFFEDRADRLWVGTDAGVARARGDGPDMTFAPVDLGEPVPVWALAESAATPGDLWIGTVGAGLVRYTPQTGETTRYTTTEGLPSDLVYGVLSDEAGNVWASTSRGLARLTVETGAVAVYDEAHGLQGDAFDLMAFYRSPTTGEMWFGGPNGLSRIDPEGVGVAAYRPPVAFTAVRVFDTLRPGRPRSGDTLRFAPGDNFLTVEFAALDFTAPRALRYRYRLLGVDDAWRQTTGERPFATYTDLDPGTYRLEVIGANADGVENEAPAVLTLVVAPAWWQRLPVQALAVLALAGLGVMGVLLLLRQVARAERLERHAVADDLHAGPLQHVSALTDHLRDAGGGSLGRARDRVEQVESGLHDALLRLAPSAVGRIGLERALAATAGRFRRAAPAAEIVVDGAVPDGLPDDLQRDVIDVVTHLAGHALREAGAATLRLAVTEREGVAEVRVASGAEAPFRTASFRDRLRGRPDGISQALRVIRARGGSLSVDRAEGGSTVVARLPPSGGGARRATTGRT